MHTIPIESSDIRAVYLMEIRGQKVSRQVERNHRIERIRRKVIDACRAKVAQRRAEDQRS